MVDSFKIARTLTRTIKVIFLSQFLRLAPAVKKITANLKPGYAPLLASKLLYPDSKVASGYFVPRYCACGFNQNPVP
jgi:hypothetical protein